MKRTILAILAMLLVLPLAAQAPVKLDGVRRAEAVAALLKANDIRNSMQFDFVMTRHSSLLTEDLVSRGKAAYVYPDKVRWEVERPRRSLFVLNGGASTDRRMQALLRNVARISEKGLVNEEDFDVTVYADQSQWQFDLVPLRRDLAQLFTLITLLADPVSGALRSVVLTEAGGDVSYLQLSHVLKGVELDESLFVQP